LRLNCKRILVSLFGAGDLYSYYLSGKKPLFICHLGHINNNFLRLKRERILVSLFGAGDLYGCYLSGKKPLFICYLGHINNNFLWLNCERVLVSLLLALETHIVVIVILFIIKDISIS